MSRAACGDVTSGLSQERARERNRRYREANRERIREPDRDRSRRYRQRRNGMWPADLAQMREEQQGRCYLCRAALPENMHIDHDHRCPHRPGESCNYCRRGLTCPSCNMAVGLVRDDPDRLRRIADNLEAAIADVTRRLADKPDQGDLFEQAQEAS